MRILHLSDLHFKNNNISQDIVLGSLLRKIEELAKTNLKPNTLIITGDIAFSGKENEYKQAKEFIDNVVRTCSIDQKNICFIPGNHDVDRSKIKNVHFGWWYYFKNESELTQNLGSDECFPKLMQKKDAYFSFVKSYSNGNITYGRFGEYVYEIGTTQNSKFKVKVVGLNSAIFCGYDGDDKEKLAVGLEQVNACEEKIKISEEIIISCIHHPFNCFHSCEKASLNTLTRFSDIILSGHVHESSNSARTDGNSGQTVFISAGSSYETREKENGFNIIDIDSDNLSGQVTFFKYKADEHIWIQNKDINHQTDGIFKFKIPKQVTSVQNAAANSGVTPIVANKQYIAVLNIEYDELNRNKVDALLAHLATVTGDKNVTITRLEKGSVKIYFETKTDVSDSIKEQLKKSLDLPIVEINQIDSEKISIIDKSIFHWRTFMNPEFTKNIENPGAAFIHSRVDDLKLKDLYVSPYFKSIKVSEKVEKICNSEEILKKKSGEPLRIVIYGADNSGKSTLGRWWYEKYYDNGYIPIMIPGSRIKDISAERIMKMVQSEFNEQYTGVLEGNIENYDRDRIILIIDDFHRIRFTKTKYKVNLISNLSKSFSNLIIIGNDIMQYEAYTLKAGNVKNILEDFSRYQIIEFGPKLRYELIKKWNSLGIESLEKNDLIRINNETEKHVESIIGKNFVPSYPVYLLTILQAREATTSVKPEYSLHGFYYELLINDSLNKAIENKSDISLYYNFITDYCYFLFDQKIRLEPLHEKDFTTFLQSYCEEYKVKKDIQNKVLDVLISSKLLKIENGTVSIAYKYVYYFFVAKYLANNISTQEIKDKVGLLCERTYRDEFASIIMFLTHLSKDQFILNKLLDSSKELFSDFKPLRMDEDISFVNEMVKKLPEQVFEPVDVEKVKEEELKDEEALINQEREFDTTRDIYNYDLHEDISTLDVLSKLTKAFKTIEILGQVTKKYWGELKAPQKFELAEETYMLGLRTLGFYFSLIGEDTELLVEYLKHIYKRKNIHKSLTKVEVDKASRNFLFGICTLASFAIIKRVANSIGYENLSGTFEDILKAHNYNSVKLIDVSIKLDHDKDFPIIDVRRVKKDTEKNFLSNIVLKNLVINYLYVFYTSFEDKQKICALLDIKLEQQRMIDATSVVKRE